MIVPENGDFGHESTLTAVITRWQKGFRKDPFRQFVSGFPPRVDLHLVKITSHFIIAA